MYVFDGNRLDPGYPRQISSLGLPPEVDHIDAAMIWGYNSKTYFYTGNIYWRYDEEAHHVELDYPREITTMWKGMGSHFDAVFQWKDGGFSFIHQHSSINQQFFKNLYCYLLWSDRT